MSKSPFNPPDMPVLAYRARTYATSLASMLANVSRFAVPTGPNAGQTPLAGLRTRQPSDPTLALLDAWAIVMDVLCFYQERIARIEPALISVTVCCAGSDELPPKLASPL